MPRETNIQVVEEPFTRHINFAADGFFCRSAVEANRSLELACREQFFNGDCGPEACRAEQVMAAAVTRSARFQRLLNGRGLLRHARYSALHLESLPFGVICKRLRRARLAQSRLGKSPNLIAQSSQLRFMFFYRSDRPFFVLDVARCRHRAYHQSSHQQYRIE